jgi:hypothetical protein
MHKSNLTLTLTLTITPSLILMLNLTLLLSYLHGNKMKGYGSCTLIITISGMLSALAKYVINRLIHGLFSYCPCYQPSTDIVPRADNKGNMKKAIYNYQ